jgi:hypothetical protein
MDLNLHPDLIKLYTWVFYLYLLSSRWRLSGFPTFLCSLQLGSVCQRQKLPSSIR